ncbi:MAG TPA: wax ester/triacylglycerol synthase family O-acyltransferase [Solirubrobacterales bacterium]|nr:wax ester/triacylglycerol synthase family O-acyltransferase [Solirubrobacterales bacterium]
MSQHHLDRLTSFDTSFLLNEKKNGHMAIGTLLIGEGPAPSHEECLARVGSRLHLTPRQRQRLTFAPLWTGTPYWVDYPEFELEEHVHRVTAPAPGGKEELTRLISELMAPPLDRSRPLWQIWFVDGLAGGRFAILYRFHHAMADGLSVLDIAKLLADGVEPEGKPAPAWHPNKPPNRLRLGTNALAGFARLLRRLLVGLARSGRQPRRRLRRLGRGLAGLWAWTWIEPAPRSPFNVAIGPRRCFHSVTAELETFKRIKSELGGTVNDVALSVVATALRKWLLDEEVETKRLHLRALVPVSTRTTDERNLGNSLAAMRGPLPIHVSDSVERLHLVSAGMEKLKTSKQALGAETLWEINDWFAEFAPVLLKLSAVANFTTRYFNLLVTNLPGPPGAAPMLGRTVTEAYPIGFLAKRHALSIAIASYNGRMNFGILADPDAIAGVDRIAAHIEADIETLAAAAERSAATPVRA